MTPDEVKEFNKKLFEEFGYFSNGQPNYRLVWSEDQFEKRLSRHTREGFELLTPQIVEVPKYRQWIHERYLLEKLCIVPIDHEELTVAPLSYECLWVFQNKNG